MDTIIALLIAYFFYLLSLYILRLVGYIGQRELGEKGASDKNSSVENY